MKKGLAYFREAIALDPTFAQAYVGVADSYATLGLYAVLPPKEAFPAAKEAGEKELGMDRSLAGAQANLGLVAFFFYLKGLAARREIPQCLREKRKYAKAHPSARNELAD